MPTRTYPLHEAARLTRWQLLELGREVRIARIAAGRTQASVARSVHTSGARISRVERGLVPSVTLRELARIAGAVGLKLYVRAYPAMRRLLDKPQLSLYAALRQRSHGSWRWETEVAVPIAGDLRAGDAVSTNGDCSILYELMTRFADFQAQTRSAKLKRRDLAAERLILVVANTRANRAAVREAGHDALADFPISARAALRALSEGRDPGGDAIVFL
ncbi:MAG: helix-turn-helix domain-containing protein [Chloroflexota bacterium]|nr:helix-turn-helix domain-containing protein [Chloroflexota bacterium]